MKAKKSLGQHFLIQPAIASKIASSLMSASTDDIVIEVGPGKGMLTQYLLPLFPKLCMIDTDIEMIDYLKNRFPDYREHMIHKNFLETDLLALGGTRFFIIGNFPYNISSQILFKLLACRENVPELVGMFQKEVAERIAARHGSKTYGILSVLIQTFFQVETLFQVSPSCFNPPPNVQSMVIRLINRNRKDIDIQLSKQLVRVVKLAFNQRRKMLRNSLRILIPSSMEENKILEKRPEQLSVDDFLELTKTLILLNQDINGEYEP